MPRFKVGDRVRVKAGTIGRDACWYGQKKTVSYIGIHCGGIDFKEGGSVDDRNCLEPWNPAEEWNGSAWVKKEVAKPCVIGRRGPGRVQWDVESTNAAFRKADELANQYPGEEFVVYQEKGSRRVEKKSKAAIVKEWLMGWPAHQINKGDDHNFKDLEGKDVYAADITQVETPCDDVVVVTYKLS